MVRFERAYFWIFFFSYDRYGHIVTCTQISKIKLDDLLTDFDAPTLQTFQAQKLCMIQHLKRMVTRFKGERTYKHSCVIDLNGLSLSMLAGTSFSLFWYFLSLFWYLHAYVHTHAGEGKNILKAIMSIGNLYVYLLFLRWRPLKTTRNHLNYTHFTDTFPNLCTKCISSMHPSSLPRFGKSSHLGFIPLPRQKFEL